MDKRKIEVRLVLSCISIVSRSVINRLGRTHGHISMGMGMDDMGNPMEHSLPVSDILYAPII